MTETSPLGTVNTLKAGLEGLSTDEQLDLATKAGRGIFGCELRIVDDEGSELPWDGVAYGALQVRGPWVCSDYFKLEGSAGSHTDDGWFDTGDVATIDPQGYMAITDRTKDVIKSGGEWISSIELENTAMGHPAVAEAAVIGVAHPKWTERPLLVVVKAEGQDVSKEELLAYFKGKVATGGFLTTSHLSTSCRIRQRAKSRRLNCASNSPTMHFLNSDFGSEEIPWAILCAFTD